ncbi:MAG: hypothetical protein AB7G21_13980 [Dehalococcoidia bacterium]
MNWLVLFDPEVAGPLLAGWIVGAAVGLADTAILVIAVARSSHWPSQFSHFRVSMPAFAIAAANAMVIGWTLVGLLFGAMWIAVPMPGYSIGVGGAFAVLGVLYAYIRGLSHRGEAQVVLGSGLLALVGFAGVVPLLAGWR